MIDTEKAPKPFEGTDVWASKIPGSLTGGLVATRRVRRGTGGLMIHGWPRSLWPERVCK